MMILSIWRVLETDVSIDRNASDIKSTIFYMLQAFVSHIILYRQTK